MTEAEWWACNDPEWMLQFLHEPASARKLRLFVCACSRLASASVSHQLSEEVVKIAERYADAEATEEELGKAQSRIWDFLEHKHPNLVPMDLRLEWYPADLAFTATFDIEDLCLAVMRIPNDLAMYADEDLQPELAAFFVGQVGRLPTLMREIFGPLPFRHVTLDLAWLTSNVVSLAQAIYDERAFDRMPFLADALEDGGCTDADILGHCRQPGEHVRGCWLVDLLLGKQ